MGPRKCFKVSKAMDVLIKNSVLFSQIAIFYLSQFHMQILKGRISTANGKSTSKLKLLFSQLFVALIVGEIYLTHSSEG